MFKDLISQGEGLRSTFPEGDTLLNGKGTSDREGVVEWIARCIARFEDVEMDKDSTIYMSFSSALSRVPDLRLNKFDELLSTLKGVDKEYNK